MLYLRSVKIRNFRQLRNIDVDFGVDNRKPLTVIRAENRTGKTTFLTALSWALFGDNALKSRREYRMHPIDWDYNSYGYDVNISVEIAFTSEDEESLCSEDFILTRSCIERVDHISPNKFDVSSQDPVLLRLSSSGHESVDNPNAFITRRLFPLSLKDIFITDGDKTLSFIDSDDTTNSRQKRVKRAIRSLMQLEALERAEEHLKGVRRDINRVIEHNSMQGSEENRILKEYNELEDKLVQIPASIDSLEEQKGELSKILHGVESDLENAYSLAGGDPAEMITRAKQLKQLIEGESKSIESLYADMSSCFRYDSDIFFSRFCERDLSSLVLFLNSQIESGAIPDVMPKIVQDRLDIDTCICGLKISDHPEIFEKMKALASGKKSNENTMFLLQLKHDIQAWISYEETSKSLNSKYKEFLARLVKSRKSVTLTENQLSDVESKLGQIEGLDIEAIRNRKNSLQKDERELMEKLGNLKSDLDGLHTKKIELKAKRDKLLKQIDRRDSAEDKLTALEDMLRVITTTIQALGVDTLDEVSEVMNTIFQRINVQYGNEGSVIQKVGIAHDHEITVEGINGKKLVPSTDISGAQKRALTLAFIFATVQVSGEELPNIIDTPLGTQSGELKRLMLQYTAQNTKQGILFLTSSEIYGVEDVIREHTSKYWTLSHADHYPLELVNEPPVLTKSAFICECDIWSSCSKCARKEGAPK